MNSIQIRAWSCFSWTPTLGLFGAFALIAACQHLPSNASERDMERAIASRIEAYQVAWNTHDASALSAFFTVDADMVMGNGAASTGSQAIVDWWSRYFAKIEPERRGTFTIDSARRISPKVALVNVTSRTGGRDSQGNALSTRLARGTWVLVHDSGCWLVSAMRGLPAEGAPYRAAGEDAVSNPGARPVHGIEEANKALARVWFDEVINQRELNAIDEHYAQDYVHHGPEGAEILGIEAARAFAASILSASADRVATVEQQVAEGNLVVTRFVSRGTHTGVFRGIEPTGEEWTTEGICISRIEHGKIAEDWEIVHVSGL